jgi:hypothetical protein
MVMMVVVVVFGFPLGWICGREVFVTVVLVVVVVLGGTIETEKQCVRQCEEAVRASTSRITSFTLYTRQQVRFNHPGWVHNRHPLSCCRDVSDTITCLHLTLETSASR